MAKDTLVAVDLAKSVFEVAVSHHPGQVAKNSAATRATVRQLLAQLPPATVVMEACGSAHFWARRIRPLGHDAGSAAASRRPPLRPPQQDRPHRHQGNARGLPQRGDSSRPGQDPSSPW